jgi:hypothetical protein
LQEKLAIMEVVSHAPGVETIKDDMQVTGDI